MPLTSATVDIIKQALRDSMVLYRKTYGDEEAKYWDADCNAALAELKAYAAGKEDSSHSHAA